MSGWTNGVSVWDLSNRQPIGRFKVAKRDGTDNAFNPDSKTVACTWGDGTVRVLDGTNPKGGWKLTRTDLAQFITRELHERQWSRAAPTLAQ